MAWAIRQYLNDLNQFPMIRAIVMLALNVTICFSFYNDANAQNGKKLLAAGIYEEEVNGNLEAAIDIYSQITKDLNYDRGISAEALYRLGVTYEKLGTQNALKYYRELVSRYSDQTEFVVKAERRIKALNRNRKGESNLDKSALINNSSKTLEVSKVDTPPNAIRAISPNGRYFTYAARYGNLAIYDRMTKEQKLLTPNPPNKDKGRSLGAKGISTKTVWAPDSKKIAYFWVRQDEGDELRIYDMESGIHRVLCPFSQDGVPMPFEWTKDGKHILGEVWNKKTNQFSFVLVDIENGITDTLLHLPNNDHRQYLLNPSLSPNGQFLLFDDFNEDNKRDIFLANLKTGVTSQLIGNIGSNEMNPLWLPDGNTLLFFSDQSNSPSLWKANLTEDFQVSSSTLLVGGLGIIYHHIGLTDEDIYYYWSHVRILNLYSSLIDLNKNEIGPAKLIKSPNLDQRLGAVWSPDGSQVAYLRIGEGSNKIEIKDIATQIEETLELNFQPWMHYTYAPMSWSPDGKKLLITIRNTSEKSGTSYFSGSVFETVIVDIETKTFNTVTSNASQAAFDQNQSIYFIRDRSIVKKNLLTGSEETIYSNENLAFHFIRLSPNGKLIGIVSGF